MPLHAILVLVAGVLTLYVGAVHLLIYAPRTTGRSHLSFGVTCALIGCYDFLCVGLYSATTVDAGANWQHGQSVMLALISGALPWFVAEYLGVRTRPWLLLLGAYASFAALCTIVLPDHLTWQADVPLIKHVSFFGLLSATYYESTPGLVTNVQSSIGVIIAAWTITMCVWGLRRDFARALPMSIAVIIFVSGIVSDTLVSSGITSFLYIIEYTYLGLVLVMTVPLTRGVAEAALMRDALAAEKERLLVTLRSIGDAVIATDADGRVQLMNDVAEKLTGWGEPEAVGQSLDRVFVIVNEADGARCENPVTRVLRSGAVVTLANHTVLISRDGRRYQIADSGAPIRDHDGRTVGVVLVFRDTTERQLLEEKLLKAQRLESLGILAGGIAHDFNNLLTGVYGFVDLARTGETVSECRESLTEAMRTMERARGFTQQLLTFARGGSPHMRVISLRGLIEDNTRFALSGTQVAPSFAIASDLWPCSADANQIGQIIDNIVINAQQAMPVGGTVRVSAENVECPSTVPLPAGNYVRIRIADTGSGIPPEHLPHIFDPFFTTKQKGSGLGLATAYSVVGRHGGHIEAESRVGKGTTFTVYLPAKPGAMPELDTDGPPLSCGSGTILVMDDVATVREVTVRLLRGAGYQTLDAANGEEALRLAVERQDTGEPLSACLLDLTVVGGKGGEEIAPELRRACPGLVLLAISGYSDNDVMARPREHGFDGAVRKPFSASELTTAVAAALKA